LSSIHFFFSPETFDFNVIWSIICFHSFFLSLKDKFQFHITYHWPSSTFFFSNTIDLSFLIFIVGFHQLLSSFFKWSNSTLDDLSLNFIHFFLLSLNYRF
jgi:hypothetical protein